MIAETIDLNKAKELIERAIDERGADYIYQMPSGQDECAYFHGKTPGCIVGLALSYVGLTPQSVGRRNTCTGAIDLINALELPVTNDATDLFDAVQRLQDRGDSWSEAYQKVLDGLEA